MIDAHETPSSVCLNVTSEVLSFMICAPGRL